MSPEIDEGAAYLMALKNSASGGSATAAGRATAPAQQMPPGNVISVFADQGPVPVRGAEKRRSPRQNCAGSAEIREEGRDIRTWSTFTDISMHGCYVESQATYPTGTILHMKLEANGIRVESKGIVRVNYSHLGMGIAFLAMSADNTARLKELLGSLSRPYVKIGPGSAAASPNLLGAVPPISDPLAVVRATIDFFHDHSTLTRDEFLTILRESQPASGQR